MEYTQSPFKSPDSLSPLVLAPRPGIGRGLFFDAETGCTYVYMDGALRLVPDGQTGRQLFRGYGDRIPFNRFDGLSQAPHPIGPALMNDAKLVVRENNDAMGTMLTDRMPWDEHTVVLRRVINPEQMADFEFDWKKTTVLETDGVMGVPLAITSDDNVKAAETLAGLEAIHRHVVLNAELNPYFQSRWSAYAGDSKSDVLARLESQLAAARVAVDALPRS
ncbi:hypothetical protein [Synoicihabitans lomoniglobus]|uniref:Uncharacterized protein n=1 Tax=Synoicihabitans lomoniglobus TaxID=2909285 RepID=A0AAE9ZVX5_9BACT|nr:hypothetical protein [Opitutaceae bacterium LMO-M01]WED65191.1 hypothetical protein PXH66_22870 [Opitutaceae bacterium LMO-M01]